MISSFLFNNTSPTEIYTLSLHDALPIWQNTEELESLGSVFYEPVAIFYRSAKPFDRLSALKGRRIAIGLEGSGARALALDRKSTRLNSSHSSISYAVFCLKKKN